MCAFAHEIRAEDWPDESCCPNCHRRLINKTTHENLGGPARVRRSFLECRDCGAYSTWRIEPITPPPPPEPPKPTFRRL